MKLTLFILLLASLTPKFAFAQASGVGGGGTGILKDDNIVLSDEYVDVKHPKLDDTSDYEYIQLPKALMEELVQMKTIARAYAGANLGFHTSWTRTTNWKSFQSVDSPFFDYGNVIQVMKGEPGYNERHTTQYIFTSTVPTHCPYITMSNVVVNDPAAKSVPIACTIGRYTYLIKENFKKMKLREQAKLIVHERLRAQELAQEPDADITIAKVSQGYEVLLKHLNLQRAGVNSVLSAEEIEKVGRFQVALKHLPEFSHSDVADTATSIIWPNGGGHIITHSNDILKNIDPSVFIGIGVVVGNGPRSKPAGELLEAQDSLKLALNSRLTGPGMTCYACEIGEGSEVEQFSNFSGVTAATLAINLKVGSHTKISNVFLAPTIVKRDEAFGDGNNYDDIMTAVTTEIGSNSILENVRIRYARNTQWVIVGLFDKVNFRIGDQVNLASASVYINQDRILGNVMGMVLALPLANPLGIANLIVTNRINDFSVVSGFQYTGVGQTCLKKLKHSIFAADFTLKNTKHIEPFNCPSGESENTE